MKKYIMVLSLLTLGFVLSACDESPKVDLKEKDLPSSVKSAKIVDEDAYKKVIAKALDTKVDNTGEKTVQKTFNLSFIDQDSTNDSSAFISQDVIGFLNSKDDLEIIRIPYNEEGKMASKSLAVYQSIISDPNETPSVTIIQKDSNYKIIVTRQPYITYSQAEIEGTVTEKSESE